MLRLWNSWGPAQFSLVMMMLSMFNIWSDWSLVTGQCCDAELLDQVPELNWRVYDECECEHGSHCSTLRRPVTTLEYDVSLGCDLVCSGRGVILHVSTQTPGHHWTLLLKTRYQHHPARDHQRKGICMNIYNYLETILTIRVFPVTACMTSFSND